MTLARAAIRSRKGRILIGAAACYLAWQGWLTLAASGKIAPELRTGGDRVNVQVLLPFTPERFHVIALQRYGRVSGTADTLIELRGVNRADLTAVARPYWVARVEPLPPER